MASYDYIVTTGVVQPDTSSLMADVVAEYQTALGADIIATPDTPEGLLIAAEVSARSKVLANNAALANQINPNIAGGVFLDAIWALTGGQRQQSTQSQVAVTCSGVSGTIITTSVLLRSTAGDLWQASANATIPSGGSITVIFNSVQYGQITAGIGTVTQIVTGVLGLETVTNPAAATSGQISQSDVALKTLRKNMLGLNSTGLPTATIARLYAVKGVQSLQFLENVSGSTVTISGISLVRNSIWVCVNGGSNADIAAALLASKGVGCGYNGATPATVTDESSGQPYTVLFDRPSVINIQVEVSYRSSSSVVDPTSDIITAVLNYAAGLVPNEAGFVVGGNVSPFEIAGAVNYYNPTIYVQNVRVCVVGGSLSSAELVIAKNQIAAVAISAITVVVAS